MDANENTQTTGDDLVIPLYFAAMSLPESERADFLANVCGGDTALRAEVERRVSWERKMGGFLAGSSKPLWEDPVAAGATLLRRFRILRVAGEGGMARVFEAFDEKLGKKIALKCPRFEFRQRVTPEVLKALSVTHENVCRVFEIHTMATQTGELDFLTMEFIDGETLAERMAAARPRWLLADEGRSVARQICAGLTAVHAAGVIHRDLKPRNVMLSPLPKGGLRAVIMDFGIAQGNDLFSGQVRGTPPYLAPELWRGQAATVQSDLYALGVLLFEMATGEKPFPEKMSWRERLGAVPPLPDVAEPIRSAIGKCLHPDPQLRPRNVSEIDEALRGQGSRRMWLRGTAGAAAAAMAGWVVNQQVWPSSPVRIAMLPARKSEGGYAALMEGFRHDLAYRFKTMRGARRPFTVFSYAQSAAEGVTNRDGARRIFGATHVLDVQWLEDGEIAVSLEEAASGKTLGVWRQPSIAGGVAASLFDLQSQVVPQVIRQLSLRSEAPHQSLAPDAYESYLRGLQLARTDYQQAASAIPYFERVIALAASSPLGYAGLAEATLTAAYFTRDGSLHGKALAALARAEQLDPESAHVQLMLGRLNAYEGMNERALANFRRSAELGPQDAQAFIGMGYALLYLGRYTEAEVAFLGGLKAQPGYYKPLIDAGLFYYESGSYENARRHWREAVRLNPSHTRARVNLAYLELYEGRAAEAERMARESLPLQRNSYSLFLLGESQSAQGRRADALASFEEASRAAPPDSTGWAFLGAAYAQAGRAAEAQAAYRRGLEDTKAQLAINPRDQTRLAWRGFYHASLDEVDLARKYGVEALAVAQPPATSVRKRVLLIYDRIGDRAAAERQLNGATPDFLNEIARSEEISDSLRRAPAFQRSIEPRP